ncbi:hypothetical protein JG688_00001748 [Phytophthora aleatoria]|uniref:DAHP synthetase I/KDSA domain-containing protein n=1 Tax=Phytophthora aleatoria TaxID=2496075 RepID=A0A8J5MB90_9STRA|nr:hypothetical protein JG688_00001748 [Phytophthora aleatoria]
MSKSKLRQRLSAAYEKSVKPFVMCTLELYLSLLLVVSLFQSPDPSKRDVQELQTTFYMAWVPLICTLTLLYSGKLLGKYGPDPDNFDRNLMALKITMWVYAFVELVLDKNMVIKSGPALSVAIIFCVCDMLRFQMEAMRLIYDDEELEDEVDRLANMVITALEDSDNETAFKHAVREVIQRNRQQSEAVAVQDIVDESQDTVINEKHISSNELHDKEEVATRYRTLAMMHRRALAKTLRDASPFFLIAGPCVLESEQVVMAIADRLATVQKKLQIPVIFKASFDKANRQDLKSYRGPGLERGLEMLQQVKDTTGLPVLTDVHETHQVAPVAKVADIIQIPAFLSRQTDLLVAAANSGRLVNLKKGQMLSAETMLLAAKKIAITQDDSDFILTERGSMFGYGDLVVDARNLPKLRRSNGLVVQDVTHSIQRPSGAHAGATTSGGDREFIPTIARMAAAVGVDGFFFETHLDPTKALCDAATMLPIDELEPLLEELIAISRASKALS